MKTQDRTRVVQVDVAGDEDVRFLADEGGAMFARSHAGALRSADIAHYLADAFDPDRLRRHLARPDNVFLIARVDEARAGYARLVDGPRSDLIGDASAVELRRLYVLEAWHGRGVAARLVAHAFEQAIERRHTSMWLHVWEQNERAIRFYEKMGFRAVGKEGSPYRSSNPIALVMLKPL